MGKPKIRFKGYTDDWEQRKLGEIVEVCSGRDYKHLKEGNIPVYGTGGYMLSVSEALSYVEDAIGIGRKGTIDNPYILKAPFWTVDTLFYCIPKEGYDLNFVFDIFQNINWKAMDESTGVPSLSKTIINKAESLVPDLAEQKKVGEYFRSIDHLITLHQRKCENAKKLKKYMLQKMFPQNGTNVPEIRFEGFKDAWEQRKVGDVTKELTEYATMESELPLLTSARSGIMYQSEYRGNMTTENSEALFSVVPFDACTYRHMSDDDTFRLNINNLEKGLVSREYPVFIASEDNDLNFLVQYINSNNHFIAFCKQQKKGGTRTRLYYKVLCDFKLMVPKPEEQREISVYLKKLDHLITLHQNKCEELKNIKKFMLQNMFVQEK